ncbi:hypothetical protein SAMN02745244_00897 [Tessaracoccus bendigoensis DSM 12906]|uniref:Zn-dependent protease with chaperone function n=2 Tax=Tessaracoccus TaxID=72763 RepID=A0A1M6DDE5_9ACTN|nr:hypothetical protein SAMN02745244_00897 [Tessaracoccus bendigoensis DSM 12906]
MGRPRPLAATMLRMHQGRRLALLFAFHIAPWLAGLVLLACFSLGIYGLVTEEVGAMVVGLLIGFSGWQLFNLARLLWARWRSTPIPGVALVPSQHPRLVRVVEECCSAAGVDVPDRMIVIPGAGVLVQHNGQRKELGLPFCLLVELSIDELRAVLTAELVLQIGDEGGAGEQLLSRVQRHAEAADAVGGWFAGLYAEWLLWLAAPLMGARLKEAMAAAVRATDLDTVISAAGGEVLADLVSDDLGRAFELFALAMKRASLKEQASRIAALEPVRELAAAFWEDGCWAREKAEAAAGDSLHAPSPRDWPSNKAADLLDSDRGWWEQLEGALGGREVEYASWRELAHTAGLQADRLRLMALDSELRHAAMGRASLANLLALIEAGSRPQEWDGSEVSHMFYYNFELDLAEWDEYEDEDQDDDPEPIDPWVIGCAAAVRCCLADSGTYRFDAESGLQFMLEGEVVDIDNEAATAIASRDTTRLRSRLAFHGVDPGATVAPVPEGIWLGCLTHVRGPWAGRRDMHVWSDGVLFVPIPHRERLRDERRLDPEAQADRVYRIFASGETPRLADGNRWVPASSITGGEVKRRFVWLYATFEQVEGPPLKIKATIDSESFDSEEAVVSSLRWLTAP